MALLIVPLIQHLAWQIWNYAYYLRSRDAARQGKWTSYPKLPVTIQQFVDLWDTGNVIAMGLIGAVLALIAGVIGKLREWL